MLPLRIALRYLFSKKSHRAVNVISVISLAGVAVATMAIVVVLSVFNGFTELSRSQLSRIDPDLAAVPRTAKTFSSADSLAAAAERLPQVLIAMPSLTERALLVSDAGQKPVRVKGVAADRYRAITGFDDIVIDGVFSPAIPPEYVDSAVATVAVAVGPAVELQLRPSFIPDGRIYVPRRLGRINPANPAGAYRSKQLRTTAVFRVDQPDYDADMIIIPLDDLRSLLEYDGDYAGAIEMRLTDGADPDDAAEAVSALLGEDFDVLTRDRQQADTFRMIAVEKWITFLMLVFILIVACFNIVSTLSLMVIEKRDDMATLRALGASKNTVGAVFRWEGWLITALGGAVGTVIGLALALIQQHFGIIRLGGDPAAMTIDVYPVAVSARDIFIVLVTVLITGALIGQIARLFTKNIS